MQISAAAMSTHTNHSTDSLGGSIAAHASRALLDLQNLNFEVEAAIFLSRALLDLQNLNFEVEAAIFRYSPCWKSRCTVAFVGRYVQFAHLAKRRRHGPLLRSSRWGQREGAGAGGAQQAEQALAAAQKGRAHAPRPLSCRGSLGPSL
eukprot:SAG31_NODE_1452_length_8286_cov_6.329547_2_plen_148_part_00